jgi:hypothetical protein
MKKPLLRRIDWMVAHLPDTVKAAALTSELLAYERFLESDNASIVMSCPGRTFQVLSVKIPQTTTSRKPFQSTTTATQNKTKAKIHWTVGEVLRRLREVFKVVEADFNQIFAKYIGNEVLLEEQKTIELTKDIKIHKLMVLCDTKKISLSSLHEILTVLDVADVVTNRVKDCRAYYDEYTKINFEMNFDDPNVSYLNPKTIFAYSLATNPGR